MFTIKLTCRHEPGNPKFTGESVMSLSNSRTVAQGVGNITLAPRTDVLPEKTGFRNKLLIAENK